MLFLIQPNNLSLTLREQTRNLLLELCVVDRGPLEVETTEQLEVVNLVYVTVFLVFPRIRRRIRSRNLRRFSFLF
jgi:hypothetical protein